MEQLIITGGELQNVLWKSHIAVFDVLEGDQTNASNSEQLYLRVGSIPPLLCIDWATHAYTSLQFHELCEMEMADLRTLKADTVIYKSSI